MYLNGVMSRLLSVGTLLVAAGAVFCFASGPIGSAWEKHFGEPPAFLRAVGWENTSKLIGLIVAAAGALLLFLG